MGIYFLKNPKALKAAVTPPRFLVWRAWTEEKTTTCGYWGAVFMLRGYPIGGCGMPGILMPAPCATFMGCMLGFMGRPAKPPPLDAISGIHKWFSLYKSRKKLLLTPKNKQNKQKSRSRCQPNQLPERNACGGSERVVWRTPTTLRSSACALTGKNKKLAQRLALATVLLTLWVSGVLLRFLTLISCFRCCHQAAGAVRQPLPVLCALSIAGASCVVSRRLRAGDWQDIGRPKDK